MVLSRSGYRLAEKAWGGKVGIVSRFGTGMGWFSVFREREGRVGRVRWDVQGESVYKGCGETDGPE